MKAERRVRTKERLGQFGRRERRLAAVILAGVLVVVVIFSIYFLNARARLRAAIVDQLDLTCANQTFRETITNLLVDAGYIVDYYPASEVTVGFYRNLPTHNYALIVLRVHSVTGTEEIPYTGLFTSEAYTPEKYVAEQAANWTHEVQYSSGGETYFAVSSEFIEGGTVGRFSNSVVIMMGCNGLTKSDMAYAFLDRGAEVYVSWSGSVTAPHTDAATAALLTHLTAEKKTLNEAVLETFGEVGYDDYKSLLIYLPLDAGNKTLQEMNRAG